MSLNSLIKEQRIYWSSIELRKPYEGSMIQIQSANSQFLLNLDIITSLISSLIQSNKNNNQNTSKNSSNSSFLNKLYLQYINDIGDIKVINTLPNERIISFSQSNIQMQSAQLTELILSQYLSPNINFFEDSASNNRILGNANLTSNASFKIYSLKMVGTNSNPYSTDSQWNYTGSNHSVKTYNVSSGSIQSSKLSDLNNQTIVQPKSSIDYQINSTTTLNESNSKQICLSQNNPSQEWSQKDCQLVQIDNQDICQCRTFSSVTIVDDLSGLLTNNDQIFNGSTLIKLSNFKWYAVAIFYVLACVTVIFFITLVWAVLKDQRDQLCVIFPQDKMNIIQTPDDLGKYYIPQSPPAQSQEDSDQRGRFFQKRNSRRNSTRLAAIRMFPRKSTSVIPEKESDQEIQQAFQNNSLSKLDSNKNININIPKSSDSQETIEILSSIGARRIRKGECQITEFTFINFIFINHKLLGIFNNYDPLLSRGIRITLFYFQFLFSLSSILYFGIEINIQKTILLILITSIASSLVCLLITHGLSSSNLFIKSFGSLIFIGITLFLIYAVLAIISTTQTTSQSNIWTLQYVGSFFFQETSYMLVVMFIKYQITKPILDNIDSHNCLKVILFSKSELISLELAFKQL